MHIVYRAESLVDAHLVKDALEALEIPAFISGEYLVGGVGELPARDFLAVMVPDGATEQADACVAAVRGQLEEARQTGGDDLADAVPTGG
ncbi:MAG TPA: DUF2007 domain-containing protein [Gammaproteobacteria bacterium]|nr:DUF2007 domain-containing protein [Gammaproteobacteria bacterium]